MGMYILVGDFTKGLKRINKSEPSVHFLSCPSPPLNPLQMVLSACSPYFQQLFVNHCEKDPIVILKDVPFADMKSLLDFMYRGEVSVDQERLAAFLKVAESLRIKGLTEVNDDSGKASTNASPPAPPPQLHRINASTLPMQKRKRGRPRKLSGSSNGNDFEDDGEGMPEEMLEVKMDGGYSGNEGSDENTNRENEDDSNNVSDEELWTSRGSQKDKH